MTIQTGAMPRLAIPEFSSVTKTQKQTIGTSLSIESVKSRKSLAAFIDFPKQLHANDSQWVAPLDLQVRQFLDRNRHPFYRHGDAEAFLAKRNGRVVGRILVSDDSRYNVMHQSNIGCFGFLESIDDRTVCRTLLQAATRWLQKRGRTELMGPIDYSTNYPCGLLIEGFSTPPSVMMNHHPEYYQSLIDGNGFNKAKDLYAWWFDGKNQMNQAWRERIDRLASRYRVKVRPISLKHFEQEIEQCKIIYNESFEENWGFVRMTSAEFDHLAHNLKQLAVPELIQIAEVDGQPAGLSIAIPNLNEAIQPLGGKLTTAGLPIGLLRMLYRLSKVKTGRLAVLGVVPGYRRRGVAESLIQETFAQVFGKLGYQGAELGWTLEDNVLVNRMIERVGGRRYKTYRIYQKEI